MRCHVCGFSFTGDIYERCRKCDNLHNEEVFSSIDDGNESGDVPNMKCLSCGHISVGEIYDRCPECFRSDTEQLHEINDDECW